MRLSADGHLGCFDIPALAKHHAGECSSHRPVSETLPAALRADTTHTILSFPGMERIPSESAGGNSDSQLQDHSHLHVSARWNEKEWGCCSLSRGWSSLLTPCPGGGPQKTPTLCHQSGRSGCDIFPQDPLEHVDQRVHISAQVLTCLWLLSWWPWDLQVHFCVLASLWGRHRGRAIPLCHAYT